MRLRAAIIKVVEENRNTAESEHCTVVTTKVKRGREIIMSMMVIGMFYALKVII